jgi:hypothetical protein
MEKDFIPAEINWKQGHPKGGCTSIEMQYTANATVLATADCTEEKQFLCEVFFSARSDLVNDTLVSKRLGKKVLRLPQ